MAFFFGGRKRTTTATDAGPRHCRKCRKPTRHRVVTSNEVTSLYGVPGAAQSRESLVCSVCGATSKPSKDAWIRMQRSSMKQRRFRKAMVRGRSRGLRELTARYGEGTSIDLAWIATHEREIDQVFMKSLVEELVSAGLGVKERDVAPHMPRFVEQMKGELRAYVEANPD